MLALFLYDEDGNLSQEIRENEVIYFLSCDGARRYVVITERGIVGRIFFNPEAVEFTEVCKEND